ncbi:hypothetical protein J2S34_003450 [Nitrobacter winogradskyi]|uniref:Uncharacterized protein n=1 Tax=Nitrobacter winogradskyi TaxID=913 RepID=A0ACC6AP53_NITWI|nr:hypothetical protein [Nitrobacter winogradskyi]
MATAVDRAGPRWRIFQSIYRRPLQAIGGRQISQATSIPRFANSSIVSSRRRRQIPPRAGLADATRYALSRWDALCCFLNDGRIELDTNTVERVIRLLGRKNHLFAGSDGGAQRWATVCSLITTAKLNDIEPFTYLKDILERMSAGHPISRLDQLLPWTGARQLSSTTITCQKWTLTANVSVHLSHSCSIVSDRNLFLSSI